MPLGPRALACPHTWPPYALGLAPLWGTTPCCAPGRQHRPTCALGSVPGPSPALPYVKSRLFDHLEIWVPSLLAPFMPVSYLSPRPIPPRVTAAAFEDDSFFLAFLPPSHPHTAAELSASA